MDAAGLSTNARLGHGHGPRGHERVEREGGLDQDTNAEENSCCPAAPFSLELGATRTTCQPETTTNLLDRHSPSNALPTQTDQPPASAIFIANNGDGIQPEPQLQKPYSTFPHSTRTYLTYLLGLTITLSTLTATIYFPFIPLLSVTFPTPIQSINLTVTAQPTHSPRPSPHPSSPPWPTASAAGPRCSASSPSTPVASLGLALNRASCAELVPLRVLQTVGGLCLSASRMRLQLLPVSGRGWSGGNIDLLQALEPKS